MLDDARLAPSHTRGDPRAIACGLMAPDPAAPADPEVARLIAHILERFHETHRREFPQAIALARQVEATHDADPKCPHGLGDLLAMMFDDLESHQQREEQVLFPLLRAGGSPLARFPIARMMAEHADVEAQLGRLRTLTRDFGHPPGACEAWSAVARLCGKLDADVREHMRLENEVLFAPFLD